MGTDLVTPILCPPQVFGRRDLIMSMAGRSASELQIVLFKNQGTGGSGEITWDKTTATAVNSNTIAFGKLQTGMDTKDVVLADTDGINRAFWAIEQDTNTCPAYLTPADFSVNPGRAPWGADVAKIDALDTKQDVVVACTDRDGVTPASHGCLALFKGNGDGTFQDTPQILRAEGRGDCEGSPTNRKSCCTGSRVVRLIDMNNDGRNDIVVTNYEGGSVSVLLNTSTVPPPGGG